MKMAQVLALEPSDELRFKGPFTDVVTAELKLRNPSDKKVCFKVKTTAPKRYCVRPNSGIIEPGQAVAVAVMLQPFEYDPTEKNRHKFMVQTMFAPDGKVESMEQLWKDVTPEDLMDSKLKCVFDMPAQPNNVTEVEEKAKSVKAVETVKISPIIGKDSDTKRAMDKLSDEISQLRDENNKLKDEGVRLRKVAIKDTVSSTPSSSKSTPAGQVNPTSTMSPVAFLVIALILGFIFGKFIF